MHGVQVSVASPSTASPRAPLVQRVVDAWRERHGITGVSVAVRERGEPLAAAASGVRLLRDGAERQQLTVDDTFHAASITKTIGSALTLQLADEGRVDLAERVAGWRPDIPRAGDITLGKLLDHTSGIGGYVDAPEFRKAFRDAPLQAWSRDEAIRVGASQPRPFEPQQGFNYSNTNYLLVQDLLERRTGRSFDELVGERLASPLGIDQASVHMTTLDGPRRATADGHGRIFARLFDAAHLYQPGSLIRSVVGADGGLVASAPALAALGESILWKDGRALSTGARAALTGSADSADSGYGLGVYRAPLTLPGGTTLRTYGHNGGIDGYASLLLHAPEHELTVALLANDHDAGGKLEELAAELVHAVRTGGADAAPA